MAESSEGEEEGKLTGGNPQLVVDDGLREMAKKAAWSVSSCKPGNGVASLRDDNLDTYWQSDGAQPHLVNIQFQKKVKLQLVVLYVDFKLDESYTPSKISIRAGDGFHNLKEIKSVELVKPTGWVYISLSGSDPRETFVNTFMLQIAVLSNHLNGRDTHVRQIKVYGPQPNPIPRQPFQFTSTEFITYSTLRSISAGTLVLLFLFCYLQQQAAMAQRRQCVFSDITSTLETAQQIVDLAGSECLQAGLISHQYCSGCCMKITQTFNITCACSPDSGLTVPQSILNSAKAFCGVSIPQLGRCQGYCGSNITHIQETLRLHTQCRENPRMISRYCCSGLEQELDLPCLCSTASRMVVIPPTLVSAISRCNIPVPQTGPCQDPTSSTVVEDPFNQVSVATYETKTRTRRHDIRIRRYGFFLTFYTRELSDTGV